MAKVGLAKVGISLCHRVQGDSVAKAPTLLCVVAGVVGVVTSCVPCARVPRVSRDVTTTGGSSCPNENTHRSNSPTSHCQHLVSWREGRRGEVTPSRRVPNLFPRCSAKQRVFLSSVSGHVTMGHYRPVLRYVPGKHGSAAGSD